jgi:hypothetical protein
MKDIKPIKKLALYSVATVMCVAAQGAFAHTGIKDKVVENVSGYNALTVGHGCASNEVAEGSPTVRQNVIAVSAVFPNATNPAQTKITQLDSTGAPVGSPLPDLSEHIVGIAPGTGFSKLGLGLVTGGGTLFANIIPAVDKANPDAPIIRGLHTWAGPKPYLSAPLEESIVSATGLVPFKYGAIQFQPTSCAKSLKVRVAIANWCRSGPTSKNLADRLDVWIGHATGKFKDPLTMPYNATDTAAGKVFWPTMTVYRNITGSPATATSAEVPANPIPATDAHGNACPQGGYDLAIEPSDADIDAYLPIPTAPYPNGAPGAKYFP